MDHDPHELRIRSRGRLPHWELRDGTHFVTFRLADSLPRAVFGEKIHSNTPDIRTWKASEQILDQGLGSCILRDPRIATLVAEGLRHFDGSRYGLLAWCIMPNHVHAVFALLAESTLAGVLHSWKSFTATRANEILHREGPFWQREYFDRLIRDGGELARAVHYVWENPAKAGIAGWPWVWKHPDFE